MKKWIAFIAALAFVPALIAQSSQPADGLKFFAANHPNIQYTGRVDFSNPLLPRFWQPGVYFNFVFTGTRCLVIVKDQELWGKNHNYLEVVIDGVAKRIQTKSALDTIIVGKDLKPGKHSVMICKNTEANIGYLELVGIRVQKLLTPPKKPTRKIEFIGNSITCGAGADLSGIPCGKGVWQDQHNAYMSYGPSIARAMNAQWVLSSVSGIGLIHSCCKMDVVMPPVFDKIEMRGDSVPWNFANYQPDLVTVCLGQNDGIQDSAQFCSAYVTFIKSLRMHYPKAQLILLTSPMADAKLNVVLQNYLNSIKRFVQTTDKKLTTYFYSKQYHSGCDGHPDLAEHKLMAKELGAFIRKTMKW